MTGTSTENLSVKALGPAACDAFADLAERHNGVWGGCWCMGFHAEGVGRGKTPGQNRAEKECRVREGRAHAALVYDGETCVGWCQFGSPDELPRIKRKRAYLEVPTARPEWRITCFFVGKSHRGRGVASRALGGALEQIAHLGGGTVESFPESVEGRTTSGSFLHNGTLAMFEEHGFERIRPIGKHHWLVARAVPDHRGHPV